MAFGIAQPATMPESLQLPRPSVSNERFRFGAGASKKRRRPRPKIQARGTRAARKLAKVNKTHWNMVTVKLPDVTDFGPPRRRPGRMAERPRRESLPALNGSQSPQRYFGPRNQKRADYFKPNVVKARRAPC